MSTGRVPATGSSPLTTKGDLYTYSTTQARLAVGNNGETLVADSSQTTGLRYNPPVGSLANPIINGGFDIWQRGTSFNGAASTTTYGPDRWNVYSSNTSSVYSRQTTGDTTNLPNIQYCLRVARPNANASTSALYAIYSVETTNAIPFAGKSITLTFYARKGANYSATSDVLNVRLDDGTGTDQRMGDAYTGGSQRINSNVTLTTTWQRFALTGTIQSTATEFGFWFVGTPTGTAGAADYFEITGVQIDVGTYTASTAPTFRRSGGTLAGELAACQRYYVRYTAAGTAGTLSVLGTGLSTTSTGITIPFGTIMRVVPTSVDFANLGASDLVNATVNATAVTLNANTTKEVGLVVLTHAAGITQYRPYVIASQAATTGYIGFNAEL